MAVAVPQMPHIANFYNSKDRDAPTRSHLGGAGKEDRLLIRDTRNLLCGRQNAAPPPRGPDSAGPVVL